MEPTVVIVGAGPVGAVLALALAQRGMKVTLLESEAATDDSPRAATVHPSTLAMLGELGLMDDVLAEGLVARYFDFWDRPTWTLTARLDHDVLRDETPYPFVVQIEQHKLVAMIFRRLAHLDNVDVHMSTTVTDIQQNGSLVSARAISSGKEIVFTGDYLVGTDGGRSTVRKSQNIEFDGYTWPERFLVLTTLFDFQATRDLSFRNYIADPVAWVNLFKVAGDDGSGRWRAVFATRLDETDEEALSDAAASVRLSAIVQGEDPIRQLVHRKLYKVHQRVAASFRSGRIFLAGDAAHVNNPVGGLGLNCGIHDAMELVNALAVSSGRSDHPSLDQYERRRRALNIEFVQQQTVANKRRLEEADPERRAERAAELAAIAADPVLERQFLRRSSLLESVSLAKSIS